MEEERVTENTRAAAKAPFYNIATSKPRMRAAVERASELGCSCHFTVLYCCTVTSVRNSAPRFEMIVFDLQTSQISTHSKFLSAERGVRV